MRTNLPYDVWLRIADYLQPGTLRKLLSVNHAFFDVALNRRYRDIDMHILDNDSIHILKRLQDPYIASRVRTLRFAPRGLFPFRPPPKPRRLVSKIKRAVAKIGVLSSRRGVDFGTADELANALTSIFENIHGLTAYEIHCWANIALSKTARAVVLSAWPVFGHRLRALKLDMSVQSIGQLLSPTVAFRNLEVLAIQISDYLRPPNEECAQIISSVLLPFVNNHRLTLTSLELSDMGLQDLDISPLLLGMEYFSRLRKMEISVETPKGVRGVWHVLGLHADRLEEFHTTRYSLMGLPLYEGPALLHLTSFHLTLSVSLRESSGLACLRLLGTHITSLKLIAHTYHYTDVSNILEILEGHAKIRCLSMELDFLSPQVIDLFAERIPRLHKLCLSVTFYAVVGDMSIGIKAQEKMFCKEMSTRRYPNWRLESFEVGLFGVTSAMCDDALFRVLPQVRTRCLNY